MLKRIINNFNITYNFHPYNFEKYERNKIFYHSTRIKCVFSFHIIFDLIYRDFSIDFLYPRKNISYTYVNSIHRVPNNYLNLLKNNFKHAYALIY